MEVRSAGMPPTPARAVARRPSGARRAPPSASRRSSTSSTRRATALTRSPALAAAVLRREAGPHLHAEITTTQLEAVTGICTSLSAAARRAGHHPRRGGRRGGAGRRAHPRRVHPPVRQLAAAGHHPGAAYEAMVERWAGLALQQDICGCHVHVGVPDLDTAVAVMDRARPYLPVLLAMTGSSPFHDGVDTGHDSYRTMWWSRWPMTGPPEYLGSAERFREVVDGLVASGVVADSRTSTGTSAPPATCRRWSSGWPTSAPRWTTPSCTPAWCARWCASSPAAPSGRALPRAAARAAAGGALARGPARAGRPPLRPGAVRAGARPDRRPAAAGRAGGGPARPRRVGRRRRAGRRLFERGTSASRQRRTWQRTGDCAQVAAGIVREGRASRRPEAPA